MQARRSVVNVHSGFNPKGASFVLLPILGTNAASLPGKAVSSLTGAVCAGQGHCTLARQHLQFPDDLPCVDLGSVDLTVQQMEGIAKFLNQRFEAGISLPPAAPALSSRSAGLLRGLGASGRVGACVEGGSPVALHSCGCCQVQCCWPKRNDRQQSESLG